MLEEGQCGRTVEAIEQPIAAPVSSHFGVLERLCLVHDSRYCHSVRAGQKFCPFLPGPPLHETTHSWKLMNKDVFAKT